MSTVTKGTGAWWLLTLPRVVLIKEIKIYIRMSCQECKKRINGNMIWVGTGLTGGNYEGATKVATVVYEEGKNPYIFTGLSVSGSSVMVQGSGSHPLVLSEVEVYTIGW